MGKIKKLVLRLFLRGSWVLLHDPEGSFECEMTGREKCPGAALAMMTGALLAHARSAGLTKEQLLDVLHNSVKIEWPEGKEA